ncbi:MAG TPA: hypothetical protein VE549_02930, partial [Myxococcaceae bacterium]|nr:hypothetical protein [Myxococcaceae bacterium]
ADSCLTGKSGIDHGDPYACRALALDADELARIKQEHPELIPPSVTQPFYCAKPVVPSAP